jgi:hypothetical protein
MPSFKRQYGPVNGEISGGGNRKRTSDETVSPDMPLSRVPDAKSILKYIENHASDLGGTQRRLLAQGLTTFVNQLGGTNQ